MRFPRLRRAICRLRGHRFRVTVSRVPIIRDAEWRFYNCKVCGAQAPASVSPWEIDEVLRS